MVLRMSFTLLYRGHKDEDFQLTNFKTLCFFENVERVVGSGLGQNDSSNPAVADGYVTTVEFHGKITGAPMNGLAQVDKYIGNYLGHEAVRFKDGVVAVIDRTKLKNPTKVKASSLPND